LAGSPNSRTASGNGPTASAPGIRSGEGSGAEAAPGTGDSPAPGGGDPAGGGSEGATGGGGGGGSAGSGGSIGSTGSGSSSSPSGQLTGTVNETVHHVDETVTGGALESTGVTGTTEGVLEGVAGPQSPLGRTVDETVGTVGGLLGGNR
jgi:hypothetical protein